MPELRARVRRLITRLTPKLRDALLLAASGEHTMDEIGRAARHPDGHGEVADCGGAAAG